MALKSGLAEEGARFNLATRDVEVRNITVRTRASCTCDVYTTSSSTSDGSTSNNARLSFSRSALVVRSCAPRAWGW